MTSRKNPDILGDIHYKQIFTFPHLLCPPLTRVLLGDDPLSDSCHS